MFLEPCSNCKLKTTTNKSIIQGSKKMKKKKSITFDEQRATLKTWRSPSIIQTF